MITQYSYLIERKLHSLLHPLLETPDRVVVVGVLEAPEGPGLVAGGGPRLSHGGLQTRSLSQGVNNWQRFI